jgi:hypothetical protein
MVVAPCFTPRLTSDEADLEDHGPPRLERTSPAKLTDCTSTPERARYPIGSVSPFRLLDHDRTDSATVEAPEAEAMARFRGNLWGIPLHTHDGNPTTRVTIRTAPTSPSDIVHDIRKVQLNQAQHRRLHRGLGAFCYCRDPLEPPLSPAAFFIHATVFPKY